MKLVKILLAVAVLAVVGTVLFLGVSDISVPQKTVTEDVSIPSVQ